MFKKLLTFNNTPLICSSIIKTYVRFTLNFYKKGIIRERENVFHNRKYFTKVYYWEINLLFNERWTTHSDIFEMFNNSDTNRAMFFLFQILWEKYDSSDQIGSRTCSVNPCQVWRKQKLQNRQIRTKMARSVI